MESTFTPKTKKPIYKNWWFWLMIVIAVVIVRLVALPFEREKTAVDQESLETTQMTTADPEISAEKYKGRCMPVSFRDLAQNPRKFLYQNLQVTGKVIQVIELDSRYHLGLLMHITENEDGSWKDSIYITFWIKPNEDRMLEGDIITAYGIGSETYAYENPLGGNTSLPWIRGQYYEFIA